MTHTLARTMEEPRKRLYSLLSPEVVEKGKWSHNIKRQCKLCYKKFYYTSKSNQFCSRFCAVRLRKGKKRLSKQTIICKECNKPFLIQRKNIRISHNFCSNNCHGEYRSKHNTGKNNANWKHGLRTYSHSLKNKDNWHERYNGSEYHYGRIAENMCAIILEECGYGALLTAGSRGPFDVLAFRENETKFIQVKRTAFMDKNYRKDIEKFINAKLPKNAIREFWIYTDGYGWDIIDVTCHDTHEKRGTTLKEKFQEILMKLDMIRKQHGMHVEETGQQQITA